MLFDISQVLKAIEVSIADIFGQNCKEEQNGGPLPIVLIAPLNTVRVWGENKSDAILTKSCEQRKRRCVEQKLSDPFSAFPVFVVSRQYIDMGEVYAPSVSVLE